MTPTEASEPSSRRESDDRIVTTCALNRRHAVGGALADELGSLIGNQRLAIRRGEIKG